MAAWHEIIDIAENRINKKKDKERPAGCHPHVHGFYNAATARRVTTSPDEPENEGEDLNPR